MGDLCTCGFRWNQSWSARPLYTHTHSHWRGITKWKCSILPFLSFSTDDLDLSLSAFTFFFFLIHPLCPPFCILHNLNHHSYCLIILKWLLAINAPSVSWVSRPVCVPQSAKLRLIQGVAPYCGCKALTSRLVSTASRDTDGRDLEALRYVNYHMTLRFRNEKANIACDHHRLMKSVCHPECSFSLSIHCMSEVIPRDCSSW